MSRRAGTTSPAATSRWRSTVPRAMATIVSHTRTSTTWYFAVEDLDTVYRRAESLGCLSEEIGDGSLPMGRIAVRPWGERSFYAHDPFGNPLCFVDATTIFTGKVEGSGA